MDELERWANQATEEGELETEFEVENPSLLPVITVTPSDFEDELPFSVLRERESDIVSRAEESESNVIPITQPSEVTGDVMGPRLLRSRVKRPVNDIPRRERIWDSCEENEETEADSLVEKFKMVE